MVVGLLGCALVAVSGCAKIPDVSSNYYLTKSALRLDVSRALRCSGGGQLEITDAVSPVISNFADPASLQEFDLKKLKGPFTDPNVTVTFSEDGRLKGINSTQTGTASQIVESALGLAKTLGVKAAGVGILEKNADGTTEELTLCEYIAKHGNKNGILTLQYSAQMTVPSSASQKLEPVGATAIYEEELNKRTTESVGNLRAHVHPSDLAKLKHPVTAPAGENTETIRARQLTRVKARILAGASSTPIWNGTVLMALKGNEYEIPLPKTPAFGKNEFVVAFSDAGTLTTLKYASESGTADAISLVDTTVGDLQGPSAADQAKALQAEADLIKQRERLAACRADPTNCN